MKKNYLKLSENRSNFYSLALKLKNLSTKIDELINSGKFWKFTETEQSKLTNKLNRLFKKLSGFNPNYALKIAGAAICFALISNTANAQVFNEWTDNPFASLNIGVIDGAFADIDYDGDDDAILLNESGYPVYFENIDGVYTEPTSGDPFDGVSLYAATGIDIDDMDGDGDLDAFFIDGYSGEFTHFIKSSGDATFHYASGSDLNDISTGIYRAKFCDVDGDDDLDILGTNSYFGITALIQDESGDFTEREFVSSGSGIDEYSHLNIADMDGDGDDDLFVFSTSGSGVPPYHQGALNDAGTPFRYFENTPGNGNFVENLTIPLPLDQMSDTDFPLLADLDGDDDIDIFTPNDPTNATGNLQNGGGSTVPVSPLIAFALFAAGGFGIFRRNRKKNKA